MTNHYHILGLEYGASEAQVRTAYRMLAKRFHPDVNPSPEAEKKFMEINVAYEFLMDATQRNNYERMRSEQLERAEQERRENIYKLWLQHQERQLKYRRAVEYAYRQRGKTAPNIRFLRGANGFFNAMFLILFVAITVIPIWSYFDQFTRPIPGHVPFIYFLVPAVLGVLFLGFGYYYWFILKTDRN